jgi:hypothetical protein
MELPDNNDLEKFIHQQLQKLPEYKAPDSLVTNVLSAIAARKKLPWWKQSFTFWPRRVQCLLYAALSFAFVAAIYGTARAADNVAVPDVSGQLSSYAWVARTIRSVGEALFLSVFNLPVQYLAGLIAVFLLLYGACLAAGFALFKVTSSAASHA